MNEKDWELLNMLHEERSITKTAKRLFFTQPTISAKIKQIEKEMGCNIVIRSVRGISFTPEGELLCQFSRRYLQDFRQIKHAIQPKTTDIMGTLNIVVQNLIRPKRFDRSVSATAGWPSLATRLMRSEMRTMPSTTENSEWTRRCTKGVGVVTASDIAGIVPSDPGPSRCA